MRPHQTALVLAAAISVLGFFLPPVELILIPLRLLNTHLHELGHALAALATGGSPQYIIVRSNTSGVTPVSGGIIAIVVSAGYLGAAAAGGAIVYAMRTEKGAQRALAITGWALAASMVLFVRGDVVGVISGILWSAALIFASRKLHGSWLQFAAGLIGLQQGISALRSLSELLQISAMSETHSDATIMQSITFIPAIFWALLWGACGIAVVGFALMRTWSPIKTAETKV